MLQAAVPGTDLTSVVRELDIDALGQGVRRERDGRVLATAAGAVFAFQKRLWVAHSNSRHSPQEGDYVIGIVSEAMGETYAVDIGSCRPGTLDVLAFDGASRRNCPNLQRGSVVFCRVAQSAPDCEPVLSCQLPVQQQHKKKDWTTGEALFGELKRGCVFQLSPATCRRLSDPASSEILLALGRYLSFELCVGMNGRFWVNAEEDFHVILVGNAIRASEGKLLSREAADALVKRFVKEMAKFIPAPKPAEMYTEQASSHNKRNDEEDDDDDDDDVDMVDA